MALFFRYAAACSIAILAALTPPAVRAADHLPIIDVEPVTTWAGAMQSQGTPTSPLVSGNINIAGTITIPIFGGLSASYDRIINGVYNNTFSQVILPYPTAVGPAGAVQPGSYNDEVQQYHLDETYKGFTLEGGLATRHRICCPASSASYADGNLASTQWQQAYLGLTYATHPIGFLYNSVLVVNVTGHSANHNPPPNALLFEQALSPGIVDIQKHEYGSTQAATLVVPVDARHGFTTTGTYTWGSFDYFENYPYPLNYGIWVFTLNKRFDRYFGVELREANLWQRPGQNTPFPSNAIHVVDWSIIADIHLDFNKLVRK